MNEYRTRSNFSSWFWPANFEIPVRPAVVATNGFNLFKTLLQTAVFWTVFLIVLPWFVVVIEHALGIERFSFPGQFLMMAVLFLVASSVGLWSGIAMAIYGKGTPLPTENARELVVSGPYKFIRNPMACAGLLQGAFVGLWAGSPAILAYVFSGFLIWNFVVRPAEEAELSERFGAAYEKYRNAVRCWVPRFRPYSPIQAITQD